MKNQTLSIEQMKHLKNLGVDVSKASMVLLFSDEYGECVEWEVENHGKDKPVYEFYDDEVEHWVSTTAEYFDAETGNYDHSCRDSCGVFTLQDMLEMMPKEIIANGLGYTLCINPALVAYINVYLGEMRYTRHETAHYGDFLKGAYQMFCWLAENGYLKGGKP